MPVTRAQYEQLCIHTSPTTDLQNFYCAVCFGLQYNFKEPNDIPPPEPTWPNHVKLDWKQAANDACQLYLSCSKVHICCAVHAGFLVYINLGRSLPWLVLMLFIRSFFSMFFEHFLVEVGYCCCRRRLSIVSFLSSKNLCLKTVHSCGRIKCLEQYWHWILHAIWALVVLSTDDKMLLPSANLNICKMVFQTKRENICMGCMHTNSTFHLHHDVLATPVGFFRCFLNVFQNVSTWVEHGHFGCSGMSRSHCLHCTSKGILGGKVLHSSW